jgi:hypothetical protein
MNVKEIDYEDVDWIQLSEDTLPWRTVENTIMSIRILKRRGNFNQLRDYQLRKRDSALWNWFQFTA